MRRGRIGHSPARRGRVGHSRKRNDPAQYDDLAAQWWDPRGAFVMLHWLAAARGRWCPQRQEKRRRGTPCSSTSAAGPACSHRTWRARATGTSGWTSRPARWRRLRAHGVAPVRGSVTQVPLRDGCADVVVAGEILEHVTDLPGSRRGGVPAAAPRRPAGDRHDRGDRPGPARGGPARGAAAGRPEGHPRPGPLRGPDRPGPRVRPARRRADAARYRPVRARPRPMARAPPRHGPHGERADHGDPVPGGRP